ncbi:MAG: hypothetical protein VB126_09195 [Paludibacter sp.]|nr:hypothetical protein [Paludibacter sp.]
MLTAKDLISIALGIVILILSINGKEKIATKIVIFLLPFGVVFPTPFLPVGLNGVLIWFLWIGIKFKTTRNIVYFRSWLSISKAMLIFYCILFIGVFMGLTQSKIIDPQTHISQINQIINYSLYIITVILFIKILVLYKDDIKFQNSLKLYFMLSIFLHLLPYFIGSFGGESFSKSIQTSSEAIVSDVIVNSDINRFSGVLGDYELIIDYILIIIALSFSFLAQRKYILISIPVLITAVFVALSSGTRSFLIVTPVFFGIFFIISFIVNDRSLKNGLLRNLFLLLTMLVILYTIFSNINLPIFDRLTGAFEIFKETGNLNDATNRHITDILPQFISTTSILGYGSLYLNTIQNNEMVSHNVLMHTYAKYGVLGLFSILLLFIKPIYLLFKKIKQSKILTIKRDSVIYISLLLSLFLQEMKISFLRQQTSMLIYAFIFILIYFHLENKKRITKS